MHAVYQPALLKRNLLAGIAQPIMLFLLLCGSGAANSSDAFWASPSSQFSSGGGSQYSGQSFNSFSNTEYSALSEQGQSSLEVTQHLSGSDALAFRYSQAFEQRDMAFGFTKNNISVSYMAGSGRDFAELGGQYAGIDPYTFHGGWHQKFKYDGFSLDYGLGKLGHIQYGQASVSADGLLDRTAKYMEWSNHRLFARATHFTRGSEQIGRGLDAGFAMGNAQIAFQTMDLDNDREMRRLRLQFNGEATRQYWIDLSSHRNPLYQGNDDTRIMFTFKSLFGLPAQSLVSHADEVTGEDPAIIDPEAAEAAKKKKKRRIIGRSVLIGVGVAAIAGSSSSGSPAADMEVRFRTQNEAAFDVLNGINPQSVSENREYGGWVYILPDGSYGSTTPVQGEAASVTLPSPIQSIPSGGSRTASYHTHAGFDPKFDNENFSPQDLESDREINVDGYLATPGGQFKMHDVQTDTVVTLGSIAI